MLYSILLVPNGLLILSFSFQGIFSKTVRSTYCYTFTNEVQIFWTTEVIYCLCHSICFHFRKQYIIISETSATETILPGIKCGCCSECNINWSAINRQIVKCMCVYVIQLHAYFSLTFVCRMTWKPCLFFLILIMQKVKLHL